MLTLKRILVPTDFSEPSDAALKYGIALARGFNANLYLLHVLAKAPAENPSSVEHPIGLFESTQGAAREQLDKMLADQEAKDVPSEFTTRVGTPYVEIIRYAKNRDIDLIVMGTHGRGVVAHMLMGSVAESVVRRAPCPVLTVRHPQHEFVMPDESIAASARVGN
jgi:nucleotide-binding universal stress UspA family protein